MCVGCVWGPRGLRALSLCASGPRNPAAAPAPLVPPGVAGQHGPGRGAAEDRQEAGEDGGQEEHGEAAEFGPQPQPPGGAARASPGVPGARAGWAPGRRVRDSGTGGRHGRGRARRPLATADTSGWACAWPGAPGWTVTAPKTGLVHVRLDLQGWDPWLACAGPGKESEETGSWKRTLEAPGLGVCKARGAAATAGRGSRRRGKTKSWVTREGAEKLELMRGNEPRLPLTPGVDLAEKSEGPRIPQPHSLRLQELLCLQLSLSLAAGWGPGGRGPNRCRAAAAPMGPAGRGKGDRLQAWAEGRGRLRGEKGPEVAGNQEWRPYLRIPERSVPGALSAGRLEVNV